MDVTGPVILSLLVSLGIQAFFFVFAFGFKTDKVTDLSYGLSFIALALFWLMKDGSEASGARLILAGMVTLWGLRIASYLLFRIIKTGRDKRFDDKRDSFVKFGKFWLLQGVAVWAIMLPAVYMLTRDEFTFGLFAVIGAAIWAIGLAVETAADMQLYRFRFVQTDKPNPWIDQGLWHYSRHPNYFGEILLWWGVFIVGLPLYEGIGWLTIIGPLTITGLLLYGSGIPILERAADKRWGDKKAYRDYKRSTSVIVPLPKKHGSKQVDA